ncbi:HbrB-like-domain-containing protein [Astrocystis sublimbata]|nr:HbrB-like-domain-containing protein [Astrocystis sublimbata]
MQPSRSQPRAPGSFSPIVPGSIGAASTTPSSNPNYNPNAAAAANAAAATAPSRPMIRRIDTSPTDETVPLPKTRTPQTPVGLTSPTFPSSPGRGGSPQNFSRPARFANEGPSASMRNASPLTLPPSRAPPARAGHVRKHSANAGMFEPNMPSMSSSNLSQVSLSSSSSITPSASQLAAQAAVRNQQHQPQYPSQQPQSQQQQQQHIRHRSQTVPFPGSDALEPMKRPPSNSAAGPRSPPMLSLTEASAPRDNGFGSQGYHNGLLGNHAATAAANVAFPRVVSQTTSPVPPQEPLMPPPPPPLPPPPAVPEKPAKAEKSKVKLFSRPKKIDTKGEAKEKPMPSPGKIGSALASLQRGNFSTTSLADSQSFYSMANSSSATIRPTDSPVDGGGKEKDKERKHHHFLSRQKHKLTSKDDHHLPLSSAMSNSLPVDPAAPSSLYNFNPPPSPGPNSALGKSVSGLDLRHGGRALREKRKEEKLSDFMRHENESSFGLVSEWPTTGSYVSTVNGSSYFEPLDPAKYGLNGMSYDDAWPYLRAKLLVIFEGEDLRLPVEDLNRVVVLHIQYCIQRRSGRIIIEDLRDLLATGFASLDHALRMSPEEQVIPSLTELWIITFTSILPFLQAVFLPLDLEISGAGNILPPDQSREFWANAVGSGPAASTPGGGNLQAHMSPASSVLDVRRMVLTGYRDALILPRYDQLKGIFSRLSLEHLPYSFASLALASPPPVGGESIASLSTSPSDGGFAGRPGTAMSLDPSVASYNSTTTTVFGNDSNPSRSRAISNVSYASGASDPASASGRSLLLRPFTPQTQQQQQSQEGFSTFGGVSSVRELRDLRELREQNFQDSKQVTDMVGRLLQCMSVLTSVGGASSASTAATTATSSFSGIPAEGMGCAGTGTDEESKMVSELGRLLKLNWLGRGRTGRNRRGIVGGRVKRPEQIYTHRSSRSNGGSFSGSVGVLREGVLEGVGVGVAG